MKRRKAAIENHALETVRKSFAHWRKHRASSKEPIPERLWKAAAGLVGPLTITEVARELGVEWIKLKKRAGVQSLQPSKTRRCNKGTSFIELSPPLVKGAGPSTSGEASSKAALEIVRADGARIVFHPDGLTKVDVWALLQQFLLAQGR